MFKEFHALLMGKDETKLDEYLEKYEESEIETADIGVIPACISCIIPKVQKEPNLLFHAPLCFYFDIKLFF